MKKLNLKPGDWITISSRDAVICKMYKDEPNNKIEIVYLDNDRAVNEDAHFVNEKWEFVVEGVCGGYADKYPRLADFVRTLRRGRHHPLNNL